MEKVRLFCVVTLFTACSTVGEATAHSGGLDSNGCHAGSQPYHCHRGSSGGRVGRRVLGFDTSRDLDCEDFDTWQQAQLFFEQAGAGDPHGLDRDRDGIACEALRW